MEGCISMTKPSFSDLELLKNKFGHNEFRAHQFESISALKSGKNVFLRKPTGGGKSLIYQFLAFEAPVLVLSPLVALMDDQTKQARAVGLSAFCMHSQQGNEEREKSLKAWESGKAQILFVTPERFAKNNFKKVIQARLPKYLIIDEAHCASMWGHDFRPDYSKIDEFKELLKNPITLACTATATSKTQEDIIKQTKLGGDCEIFKDPILRDNLHLQVIEAFDFGEKVELFFKRLKEFKGPALIYFTLIKDLENLSLEIEKIGLEHVKYHSRLPSGLRRSNQKHFMAGTNDLMLATPAFGLGVNKPDIRNLLHFALPGSIEAYAQEFGRAGRDGKESLCELFYSQEDLQVQMDFIKWSHPEPDTIRWVYRQICNTKEVGYPENTLDEMKKKMNFYNSYDFRLESAVNILKRWDCVKSVKGVLFKSVEDIETVPDVTGDWHSELKKHQQMKLYDVIKLIKLESASERDQYLEEYFS